MHDPVAEELLFGEVDFDVDELQARYDRERERRLRPDGAAQYAGATDAFSLFGADPSADPGFTREPVEGHSQVVILGGGFAGLVTGARLREAGFADIRVVEAAGDFGGTWYWNRYPGAMCDIEAHIYMPLLEEMDYAPRHRYAYADELFEYSQAIGRRYGLYDEALFQTRITSAQWIKAEHRWLVTTDRDDRITCDHLIFAAGRQSLPKLPRIQGIGGFDGHVFHSSRWDYDYTKGGVHGDLSGLSDKRVGIVGTGATALQIVPAVAEWAQELLVFQRTPSAVGPRDQCETPRDWVDRSVPGWQRRRMENFQSLLNGDRLEHDSIDDGWTQYTRVVEGPDLAELETTLGRRLASAERDAVARLHDFTLMEQVRARIDDLVTDPATAEALKPWYRWRCKRPGWHDDFLPAFNRPNVKLVDTHGHGVESFTASGVVVQDQAYELDCVIFATGFEAGISYPHLLGFDPVGRSGASLSEHWSTGTRTWFGMMTDDFPNLFFVGPNQQTTAGANAAHLIEEHSIQLAYLLGEAAERGVSVIEPSTDAIAAYVRALHESEGSRRLVEFYAECTPGYFNSEGRATKAEDLFAGGRFADPFVYYRMLREWRADGTLSGLVS